MRWSEIVESSGPQHIEFDFDGGTVEGYTVESKAEQIPNWLGRYDIYDGSLIDDIRSKFSIIALLNNINVEEDSRGEGMGNDLLESFESEARAHGAQVVFLVADIHESQADGFNLVTWYKRAGYQEVRTTNSGPLMSKQI